MTVLNNSEPAPSREAIKEFEEKLGFPLPVSFREFLLRNNGGTPPRDCCIWTDDARDICLYVQYFFPIADKKPNLESEMAAFPMKLSKNLLPICLEGSGSYLLLDLSSGSILLWDYETDEIAQLASNIDDFLSACDG